MKLSQDTILPKGSKIHHTVYNRVSINFPEQHKHNIRRVVWGNLYSYIWKKIILK